MSDELREGCIRVAAGTIVEVDNNPEPGDRVIDCRGRTIVPGLIDAHLHAYGSRLSLLEIETSPLSYLALAGARRLAGALGGGTRYWRIQNCCARVPLQRQVCS